MKPEKILENLPKKLNDIEKARYIYIELGKYFSYDEKYLIAESMDEKRLIFDKDIDEVEDDKAICSTISKIYVKLLNEAGIKAEKVYKEGKFCGHMFTKISIGDKEYKADLIHDLLEIKKGFRTKHFMKNTDDEKEGLDFSEIEDEKLIQIDKKIGYSKNGMYMDDVVKILNKEIKLLRDDSSNEAIALKRELGVENLTIKELLEYKINFIRKYFVASDLDCMNKADYFQIILENVIEKDEVENYNFSKISCVEDESKIRIFFILRDKELGESSIYTFSDIDYASKVDGGYIKEKLRKGMRTLSKSEDIKNALIELAEDKSVHNENKSRSEINIIKSAVYASESIVREGKINEQDEIINHLEMSKEIGIDGNNTIE